MATTSNSYDFQLDNDELILECFERLGMDGEQLVPSQLNSAKRSLNILLLDWISKSINLWTLKNEYITFFEGQSTYYTNERVTDVLDASLREFTTQLNGVAQTNTTDTYDNLGGGNANYAFDDDYLTSCLQTSDNGNISYAYNNSTEINFIGIRSNVDENYTIDIEVSDDMIDWYPLHYLGNVDYTRGVTYWADITRPTSAMAYRIRETSGKTLDIQQIYLANNVRDSLLSGDSKDTYFSFSQKYAKGRPTVYYFNKALRPQITFWSPPSNEYKVAVLSVVDTIQDAGEFINTAAVPSRMYPALISGLTWMLSVKYNPQVSADLKNDYEQTFALATANDNENIALCINYDLSKYYDS